eukprot:14389-Heterococcus_DN1.PRE.1
MDMLLYVRQQGCEFWTDTIDAAAMTGNLAMCQYLIAEQCEIDVTTCNHAAHFGYLEIVRLLCESGCPLNHCLVSERAAESGSVELLQYFREYDCLFTKAVMRAAARKGHTHICEFLRSQQCAWDSTVCEGAAEGGQLDTLRWLRTQGCAWDVQAVCVAAASSGDVPTMEYALDAEPAASAAQLTEMLNAAGAHSRLAAAKWLRQQGAGWPLVLMLDRDPWKDGTLLRARREGCTSPTTAPAATSTQLQPASATDQSQVRHIAVTYTQPLGTAL